MPPETNAPHDNRQLTDAERHLSRWMLEHGNADAAQFISQLENAEVTPWRCPCGCASFNFQIRDKPPAPPGVHILGDFIFGDEDNPAGIFIYESNGILSGVEVYGMVGDAPTSLPTAEELRPFVARN